MNNRIIIAFSLGYEGLSTYEMHEALLNAQEEKNRRLGWNPWGDRFSMNVEGSLHSYCIEEGIEIDMRAKKLSDMPYDSSGNFIRVYMPKDK